MPNIEKIVELLLDAARESRVLTGGIYKDEPIIRTGRDAFGNRTQGGRPSGGQPAGGKGSISRAASSARAAARERAQRQPAGTARATREPEGLSLWEFARSVAGGAASAVAPREPVPEPIARMRSLARGSRGTISAYERPRLFFEQARLMEDYVDDYPYQGSFSHYYPTYEDMDNAQLRGYFTWRARFRVGQAPAAPLSFLFVHAYELLCGVGVPSPTEGLSQLARLRDTYAQLPGNEPLASYLAIWMVDYVAYHGLDPALLGTVGQGSELDRAIATIDAAEQALLASATPGTWDASLAGIPAAAELTLALSRASRYRLERSLVFSSLRDELDECCCATFARMVDHCHRRRKRGLSDGLFGPAEARPYTIFRSAVFFDAATHPDCSVRLPSGRTLACRAGRWTLGVPHHKPSASAELGDLLHEIDRALREAKGDLPPLKPREIPKYQRVIVDDVVTACLERRAAEEAARVRIDRGALRGIRAAAVRTREALLVDEEREEVPEPVHAPELAPVPELAPAPEAATTATPEPAASVAPPAQPDAFGLSPADAALVRALLDGTYDEAALRAANTTAALAADRINEALFDLVGDTVIEFEGDVPRIVEDYADDVREAFS